MSGETRPAAPFPFEYGATTFANPWNTILPAYCEGPDMVFADNVLHGGTPAWVPRRAEDIRAVYTDHAHFTSNGMAPFSRLVGSDWLVLPLEADPPDHGLYRRALNPVFGPKAVAVLDDKMRTYARAYANAFRERGKCDFMAEFAMEFPIRIFLELMDMPQEMVADFLRLEHDLIHSESIPVLTAATREVVNYLTARIEQSRRAPGDDLVSYALAARTPDGRAFTQDELLGMCFNLFIGGLGTVTTNIGWHFYHLATHPEHQRTLRQEPALVATAMDEFLRYYSTVTTYRRCVSPCEIAGAPIAVGEFVAVSTTLAGRDDREFERPHEVDLNRRPRSLVFGYGAHLCLGVHLARRELRIAMEEALALLPEFHLDTGRPVRILLHSTITLEELPLVWRA